MPRNDCLPPSPTAGLGVEAQPRVPETRPVRLREIDSAALLGPGRQVEILHRDQRYRLRETAQGKLILTK